MIKVPLINTNTNDYGTHCITYSESDPKIYAIFVKDFTNGHKMKLDEINLIKGVFGDKVKAIELAKNYDLTNNDNDNDNDNDNKKILCAIMEYEEGNLDNFIIPNNKDNQDYKEDSKRLLTIYLNGNEIQERELYTEYLMDTEVKNSNKRFVLNNFNKLTCSIM